MNLTRSQLKTQYERAKRLGWIPHFVEAAEKTKAIFDVADLMAIGSRETNLDPKWLTKAGDQGNGFGLMQADKRSFPQFTKSEAWKDARQGILFGADVLMNKWHDIQTGIGVKRGVYSSKSKKTSYFVGKDVGRGKEAQQVTIAAYNNGRWPHYAVTNGKDPDTYTTGHDYSSDVIARASILREWLQADGYIQASKLSAASSENQTPSRDLLSSATPSANEPPIETPTEIKTTAVSQTGTVTTAVERTEPAGDPPEAPPVQVSQNGPLAKWLAGGGGLTALGTFVWGYITSNPSAVGIAVICITLIIVAIIFRHAITDAIRMQVAADPGKKNVS